LKENWNNEIVTAFLLDRDASGELHDRFGPPLRSGKLSEESLTQYLNDFAGAMDARTMRKLLQYTIDEKNRSASVSI
jgi:hypothetical protein